MTTRNLLYFVALVGVGILLTSGVADAGTTGVCSGTCLNPGGPGDLQGILTTFGIKTNFNLMDLVGFMLKPVAIYYILHGVYDAHEAWKATQYRPKEFSHAVIGAGGTGLLIGGGAGIASSMVAGSGAIFF